MNTKLTLSQIGLSDNESKIYLSLLEKGSATISEISQYTGLHRPTVYKHLPVLQKKGLITNTKKGKRILFIAESPKKLEKLLEERNEEIRAAIPDLFEIFSKNKNKPVMKFYEGKTGIKEVFEDILNTLKRGGIFYRYSSRKEPMNDKYLPKNYRKKRDAKHLERLVIASEEYSKQKKSSLSRHIKTVPNNVGLFDYDITLIIYKNKIAIIDCNSDMAYVMESAPFANFQKILFKILYNKL